MLIIDQLKKGELPLRWLALMLLVGLGILSAGLFYVQVISSHRFRASQVSQSFRTVRLPAVRGRVLDTQGVALADNRPAYGVQLYLEELRPYFQSNFTARIQGRNISRSEKTQIGRQSRYEVVSNLVAQTAHLLQHPLTLDPKTFQQHYEERLALPLPIAVDLPLAAVSRFVELAAGTPGLELEVQPIRWYPFGPLAAHTLGYLRRDDHPDEEAFLARYGLPDYAGVVGIEGVFDSSLRGRRGVKSVLVNNLGYRQSETVWDQAEAGDNIHLTLDSEVQTAAAQALQSAGKDTRGAIVVMNVHSGDLLALVSWPSFDPNLFVPRISIRDWEELQNPEQRPLINRATSGIYAPGSIFKIVVALAALEAGILNPSHVYHSPGYFQLGSGERGRRIRDTANGGQPASFDFKKAFKQSSNAYFVHYGLLTGLDDLVALGQRLHLGEKTGLPAGQEHPGIFPTPEWREHERGGSWFEGDTANLAIGQGYIAVTPIQMAVMTAAMANGGRVLWPRLVARLEPQPPERRHEAFRFPPGRVRDHLGVSARSLRVVLDAMLADVEDEDGTGRRARVPGYRIGAKTGTAQVRRAGGMDHITWFTALGPFDAPEYAVVVMVESGVSGAETCAPLARQVFLKLKDRRAQRQSDDPAVARSM